MKKAVRVLLPLALLFFCSVVGFAENYYFSGYDDDLSPWDSYETVSTQSFFGTGSDKFYYSGDKGSESVFAYSSGTNSIEGQFASKSYIDKLEFSLFSGSAFLEPGKIYRIKGNFRSSYFKMNSVSEFYTGGEILACQLYKTSTSSTFTTVYFDVIVKGTKSAGASVWGTFPCTFQGSILYGGSVDATLTEIKEHEKTVEEWLEAIYGALVGESGEGGGTSNPELDSSVSQAGQIQGSLDEFESSIRGDFESSLNDLDLGGFKLPVGILSAMSWIGTTWTSFFNGMGEMQYIILFPCFVGLALLLIGRAGMAMHVASMRKDKAVTPENRNTSKYSGNKYGG